MCCAGGDVVVVVPDGGQCKHAIPGGVVAVFQRHAGISGEVGQRLLEVSLPRLDVERLGLDDGRDGRQHRHHHLLAVAEGAVGGLDTEANHGDGVGHLPVDGDCLAAHRVERQVELAGGINLIGTRVEEFDDGVTSGSLIGGILHGGCQLGLIALAQEARHARTCHQGLLCQYFGHPLAAHHLLVPCHGLGNPGGVEVGCLKLDVDVAILVAGEHRLP